MATIGRDLDAEERRMTSSSSTASSTSSSPSSQEESNNVRDDGFFSVQVISRALQQLPSPLALVPIGSEAGRGAKEDPCGERAFLLNREQHWYTLRKFGGKHWIDLNSTLDVPKLVSNTYLGMYLQEGERQGFSIFAVKGDIPVSAVERDARALERAIAALAAAAKTGGGGGSDKPEPPRAFTGQSHRLDGGGGGGDGFDDADLQAALQASLLEAAGGDMQLAKALQASMMDTASPAAAAAAAVVAAGGGGGDGGGAAAAPASSAKRSSESLLSQGSGAISEEERRREEMRRKRLARFG